MKIKKRANVILLALALTAALLMPAEASAQLREVRVGFFAFDGYHMRDESGNCSGYGYELLQHMAGFTDWKYEFVGYDRSWSDMQTMLERGEIDLVTSAQKTPERMERFDFSEEPIGTSAGILCVRAGNSRFIQEDYSNWNGMRVGLIEGNSRNDDFDAFASEQGFSYRPVYFENVEDMVSELKEGESIDAVVTSNLRSIDGEWILAQFASSPFYIMVRKGDSELLRQVNAAVTKLFEAEPEICSELMEKYYSPDSGEEIAYSLEEREYISSMQGKTLTAVIDPDCEPYSYLQNGEAAGIICDLAREAALRSGLDIEFVTPMEGETYEKAILSGDYDLRFDADRDYAFADSLGYRLTGEYMSVSISKLRLKDGGKSSATACLKYGEIGRLYEEALLREYKEIVYCGSTSELTDAVRSGSCDAAYLYSAAAALAVERELTNRLVAEEQQGNSRSFSVAVRAELGPTLYSVMNKAVASFSDAEVDAVAQRHSAYSQPPFSIVRYTYEYPVHVLTVVVTLFILIALVMSIVETNKKRRREAARLANELHRSEQLAQALEAAKRADLAKQQFLSSMSHEIRTPLNAVIGYNTIARSDLTEARTDEERRQADMKIMDSLTKSELASKQLLNIVNDVLDMSAIESGRIKVASEPFDFRSLISGLSVLFFSQAKAKGVSFEVAFDKPTEEWFVGDQLRINQILTNLLSNAVKFTPDGGHVSLSIVQTIIDDKKSGFHFEVSDSGIGMTAEYLSRIWTPFEQAEASISRRFGGSGLGLSITKNLVDIMGGAIGVKSEPGVGSTFTVDLTLERMEQPQKSVSYDFSGINALVVDDDVGTCDYIQLLFGRCGARCVTVTSGEQALEVFSAAMERGEPFNVCMVDWRMPRMDGLETVRSIRAIASQSLPIIIVTAYDYSEVAESAEDAGVNMFVSKPLFQSALFDLLANISGKQSPQRVDKSASYDFGGARVLLAEDNKMNMEVAKRILSSSGLAVDSAWNGREAIDMFVSSKKGTYKAILMDVHMPELDGYQATRAIRASAHPEAKTIPIIAMTADAFAEDISEAHEAGMNDHVSKPIDIPTLFETLKKYIANRI